MDKMSFGEWLKANENMTSTASVATFARPTIGMTRRTYPGVWGEEDPFFKKKKKKKNENVASKKIDLSEPILKIVTADDVDSKTAKCKICSKPEKKRDLISGLCPDCRISRAIGENKN